MPEGYCTPCGRKMRTDFCLKCDKKRYNQAYYSKRREELIAAARWWNVNHRERVREHHKKYDLLHRDYSRRQTGTR